MLQITARLFKYNQLTGYRISDGQQEQDFNKMQTWMFAKENQIINVKAIGNGDNGDFSLSGTNGFELKSLPQIKLDEVPPQEISQEQSVKYDTDDLHAALVYAVTNNSSGLKNAVKIGAQIGIVMGSSDAQAYKKKLIGLEKEYFKKRLEDPDFKEKRRIWTPNLMVTHTVKIGDKVVGYTLKNISSDNPIRYIRRPLKIGARQLHWLAPFESVDLSRLEVMLTLSIPEYSGRIQNAKIILASTRMKGNENLTDWIMRGYLINTSNTPLESKQMEVNENSVKYIANNKTMEVIVKMSEQGSAYISKLADQYAEEGIDAGNMTEGIDKVNETYKNNLRTQKEVRQKLKEATGIRGIFNAFKR